LPPSTTLVDAPQENKESTTTTQIALSALAFFVTTALRCHIHIPAKSATAALPPQNAQDTP
jgi:hypothetical protein